jgi:hypothetical protein
LVAVGVGRASGNGRFYDHSGIDFFADLCWITIEASKQQYPL